VDGQTIDTSMLYLGLALTLDPPAPGRMLDPRAFQEEMMYRSTRFFRFRGDPAYMLYNADPRDVSDVKVRKVVDDLTETLLVSEAALEMGLRVSPEEIRDRILAEFTDPSTGKFRKETYQNFVRYGLRSSMGRFEEFVRREILREKMIALITAPVVVTEREAREVALRSGTTRSYAYLEVAPTLLAKALRPTVQEAASWLAENEAAARKHFEDNEAAYQVAEGYDFHVIKYAAASRGILATIDDAETRRTLAASRTDARDRAKAAVAEVSAKPVDGRVAAFEALARAGSDEATSRDRGGRFETALEAASVSALLDPAVAEVLAGLEPGEMSDVIEGDAGFFVVVLDGVRPAQTRTFDDVKASIAEDMLARQRAEARADAVAADVLARMQAGPDRSLAEIAAEVNAPFAPQNPVRIGETGAIPEMPGTLSGLATWSPDEIPGIGPDADLAAALRGLTEESPVLPDVRRVATGESRYVFRLEEATVAGEATPEAVAKVRDELLPLRRQAVYRDWFDALKTKAAADHRLVEREALTRMVEEELRARREALDIRSGTGAPAPSSGSEG
jgi:peptidyl-prolyl cis-trans isomerase D